MGDLRKHLRSLGYHCVVVYSAISVVAVAIVAAVTN